MPYISVKTSIAITTEQEVALKTRLGTAISIIPGKSESWLMLDIEDNCRLWFKGNNDSPIAFVEVKSFGTIPSTASEKLTAEVCEILSQELNIPPASTYVWYEETKAWGWNGKNF